jgi:hypothetical protein
VGEGGHSRKLRLNTHVGARRTLARLLREYDNGAMESEKFRDLVYGLSKLLDYFRLERELEIEHRLEAIERRLDEAAAAHERQVAA